MESLLLFVREFRPFWKCVWQMLTSNAKTAKSNNGTGTIVILLPGWLNDEGETLNGMREFMDENGRQCFVPSVHYFKRWRRVMTETVAQIIEIIKDKEGQRVSIIGHSLGGAVALLLLLTPIGGRIDRVITLGTPLLGSPIIIARFLAYATTGISGTLFTKYFLEKRRKKIVKDALSKVVCIFSCADTIAPPEACFIKGVKTLNLSEIFPQKKISHLEMILDKDVWKLVDKELE